MTVEQHSQNAYSPAEEASDIIELLAHRSATYALLSRLYREEIDETLLEELHGMLYPVDAGDPDLNRGYLLLATFLSNLWSGSIKELKVDYARCFLGHGVDGYSAAYPYESVYTSEKRLLMQDARDEVLAIYRKNGIGKSSDWNEGEDHIALELEFESLLSSRTAELLKAGDEEKASRLIAEQRSFLEEHLLPWAPMMTSDLKQLANTKLYLGLAHLTDGFLRTDSEFLHAVEEENRLCAESSD